MAANDKLVGVYSKIERANKHIMDLEAAILTLNGTSPNEVRAERDPETRCQRYYLSRLKAIPPHLPLIAGDAIHCLRSALDHLAYSIWLSCGGTGSETAVYFPIFDTAEAYEAERSRKIRGVSQRALDAFDGIEPYKGGKGHYLWVIHAMDNIDKHRLLITATIHFKGVLLSPVFVRPGQPVGAFGGVGRVMTPSARALKEGDVLLETAPDEEVDKDMDFSFTITLDEPGIVEGKPLWLTLMKLAKCVKEVVGILGTLV